MTRKGNVQEVHVLRIGKSGVTENWVEEAKEQIKNSGSLKVKLPRGLSPQEKDALAKELAQRTGSVLVDRRGNTAVFKKA
ncbi:MAG: YhbY family RNA-binding protein [Candidatus Thermoplasmatota archaeon]|nr:YhbY family RNA-binding protein [Candidatus Thermoplasmatota archaeon]